MKLRPIIILVLCISILSIIFGVIFTYYTQQSKERIYLWSVLLSILTIFGFFFTFLIIFDMDRYSSELILVVGFIAILLMVGFIINAVVSVGTGNTTNSTNYLLTAVIVLAIFIASLTMIN